MLQLEDLQESHSTKDQALASLQEQYTELQHKLAAWDIPGLAQDLIEQYYDKLYYRVRKWEPEGTISLEDYNSAEGELAAICGI